MRLYSVVNPVELSNYFQIISTNAIHHFHDAVRTVFFFLYFPFSLILCRFHIDEHYANEKNNITPSVRAKLETVIVKILNETILSPFWSVHILCEHSFKLCLCRGVLVFFMSSHSNIKIYTDKASLVLISFRG